MIERYDPPRMSERTGETVWGKVGGIEIVLIRSDTEPNLNFSYARVEGHTLLINIPQDLALLRARFRVSQEVCDLLHTLCTLQGWK